MQIVALIPARLDSQRIPRKALRYLGHKPLLSWVVEEALFSGAFHEVFVSTESPEIGTLAESLGATWHRRDRALARSHMTSEHFVRDFLADVECDVLAQITPTSPFLQPSTMCRAVHYVSNDQTETVLSVRKVQAEVVMANRCGVNVDLERPMVASQRLAPVYAFCNGIFVWDAERFVDRYDGTGCACYGGGRRTELLVLSGDEAIDLDTEQDWHEAELILAQRTAGGVVPRYWTPTAQAETDDDGGVLERDGVVDYDLRVSDEPRVTLMDLQRLLAEMPIGTAWSRRVVETPTGSATVISQMPGESNRRHYHVDVDETWQVLEGEYRFEIDGQTYQATAGTIATIPRGLWHQAFAVGAGRAVRLASSRKGAAHVYAD